MQVTIICYYKFALQFLLTQTVNRLFIVYLLTCIGILPASAQPKEQQERATLNFYYNSKLDSTAFLFTGDEYVYQSYLKEGSPYFLSDTLTGGSIRYNGHLYDNTELQWDILQNYILTRSLDGYSKLILRNDLIDSFTIAGHTIIKMFENKAANLYNTDFYDVLYRGSTSVYARRSKQTDNLVRNDKIIYHFKDKDKFYVNKNGLFYRVSNKREAMRLYSAHASDINRELRKEGVNWRNDFEACLIIAAAQYDQSK